MKKFLSLILALLMTVSCASFAFANDAALEDTTTAVEEETPYDDAIEYLQAVGIFKGYEDGLLHAEKDIRRFEMALLAARIATGWIGDDNWLNGNANDTEFTDLDGEVTEKYLGALSYASQMGLIEGYGDGTFKPYDNISYRDVLTIACRLIGYKNLKYPWGFIEKAVNLGLTAGIEGVAYTEPLTRGGVAQVLYNALFTEVNNTTLAAELFGVELAWADIMVVANDRYVLAGKDATVCSAGQVAYQVIEGNGLLPTVKKVNAADFGLEIGQFYRALFSQEIGGGDYTLVKVEPYGVVGSASNNGRNDMSNVKAYIGSAVVLGFDKTGSFTLPGLGGHKYAYDFVTGHIWALKADQTLDKIVYYYSADLDMYFEYEVAENGNVIYSPADEFDLIDLLKDQFHNVTVSGGIGTMSKPDDTPYSYVEVVNAPNGKTVAYYESYNLGVYYDATSTCKSFGGDSCNEDKACTVYTFKTVGLGEITGGNSYCSGCEKCIDYKLIGSANDGDFVIYGVNSLTKEIKIIKVIGTDATTDTYYAKGIVRGFRLSKNQVTIGDETFTYNYSGLATALNLDYAEEMKADKASEKIQNFSNYFKGLVNQYVKYVVLDGQLIYIEVLQDSGDEYIIVENYVGFSSDNYIVVGGYSTADLHYDLYKIAAYDQWKSGDKFWYPQNTMFDKDFARGSVYEVTSYDEEEDAYFVNTIWSAGDNGTFAETEKVTLDARTWLWDEEAEESVEGPCDYGMYEDGYVWNGSKYVKNDSKTFVVIDINENRGQFDKPIHVYSGKVPEGWAISGDVIKGTNIFVSTDYIEGFNANSYDFSMAVVLDKVITDMGYEGALRDWYVQGAMEYTVEVFDLYKGEYREVVGLLNFDLVEGAIYPVVDGYILNATAQEWFDFVQYYTDWNKDTAEYVINSMNYDELVNYDVWGGDFSDDDATWFDEQLAETWYIYAGTVDESKKVTTYFVTLNNNGTLKSIKNFAASDIADYEPGTVWAHIIYDTAAGEFVVYVYEGAPKHVHNFDVTPEVKVETEIVENPTVQTTDFVVSENYDVNGIDGDLVAHITWVGYNTKTTTTKTYTCTCGEKKTTTDVAVSETWASAKVTNVVFEFVGLEEVPHAKLVYCNNKAFFFNAIHKDMNLSAEYDIAKANKNVPVANPIAGYYACDVEGCYLVKSLDFGAIDLRLGGDGFNNSDKITFNMIGQIADWNKAPANSNWLYKFSAELNFAADATEGLAITVGTVTHQANDVKYAH